jgi:hypothetical protein
MKTVEVSKKERVSKKEKVRCVFCNSLSHKMEKCNSTLNGRRNHLDQGWDFQMHDECPNFELLAVNELRYVAWHYAEYEGAIHDWSKKTTQQYNRKFKFRPIDLTLSRRQLIKELVRRWEVFQPVRDLVKNKPEPTEEEDECPICLDCDTTTYDWSPNISNWVKKNENITTECKHSFCKKCWITLLEKSNNQRHYWVGHEYKVDICVSCPMCRHELKYRTSVK